MTPLLACAIVALAPVSTATAAETDIDELAAQVAALRDQVTTLKREVKTLRSQLAARQPSAAGVNTRLRNLENVKGKSALVNRLRALARQTTDTNNRIGQVDGTLGCLTTTPVPVLVAGVPGSISTSTNFGFRFGDSGGEVYVTGLVFADAFGLGLFTNPVVTRLATVSPACVNIKTASGVKLFADSIAPSAPNAALRRP